MKNKKSNEMNQEPKQPKTDLEEEDKTNPRTFIRIGELEVAFRKTNLTEAKDIALQLLKDKRVRNYLNTFERKKLLSKVSYVE